jgi:hypothetical protein
MRTRIELADDQRERLLQLAAERGEKGCTRIVQEAVALYLEQRDRPPQPLVPTAELAPLTRAERARLLVEWLREEVVGALALAHALRARLRRSAVAG